MLTFWHQEALDKSAQWQDPGMARAALQIYLELPASAQKNALLATDLHAGNVLQAQRKPWLVIDPKPFYGDPAYDATQHLLNCQQRLHKNPQGTISRFADLLGVEAERIALWTFARLALDTGQDSALSHKIARQLAPG